MIDIEITGNSDNLVRNHFVNWMKLVKSTSSKESYKQDMFIVKSSGKYLNLLNHSKKRIRKKNMSKALRNKLPLTSVVKIVNAYPINSSEI